MVLWRQIQQSTDGVPLSVVAVLENVYYTKCILFVFKTSTLPILENTLWSNPLKWKSIMFSVINLELVRISVAVY